MKRARKGPEPQDELRVRIEEHVATGRWDELRVRLEEFMPAGGVVYTKYHSRYEPNPETVWAKDWKEFLREFPERPLVVTDYSPLADSIMPGVLGYWRRQKGDIWRAGLTGGGCISMGVPRTAYDEPYMIGEDYGEGGCEWTEGSTREVTMLTLKVKGTMHTGKCLRRRFDGLRFVVYNSPKHVPPHRMLWYALLPFSRPLDGRIEGVIDSRETETFRLLQEAAKALDLEDADPAVGFFSRCFDLPYWFRDWEKGWHYQLIHQDGEPVDRYLERHVEIWDRWARWR
jgi:hypothetical protein